MIEPLSLHVPITGDHMYNVHELKHVLVYHQPTKLLRDSYTCKTKPLSSASSYLTAIFTPLVEKLKLPQP